MALEDMIGVAEAAKILNMSKRWVQHQCDIGRFTTAYQPGGTFKSLWKIARSEVLARRGISRRT